ncbi:type III pantothenate kinase [Flavobacterium sp. CYK-55]|uniref:type III pantothenate kinase n=1 Tax=Flavobacterium sp. CYK-55 TaxID=2835529 RepID=UPI001BCF0F71|nr:type III pantothenate kinase [Flavobacterium sp. CYK-55]MBS7785887.1 type III pantothenate kinase [Flavobacterium sp. CYK-55]
MRLAIDIGNTLVKAAVYEENTFIERFQFTADAYEKGFEKILLKYPDCLDWVLASVGQISSDQFKKYSSSVRVHLVDHAAKFPFINHYHTPQTLGIDRMILASGAVLKYPKQARLIIDVGTCITYDFVDAQDVYHGGAISPGIQMRYKALHQFTAKLPLLEKLQPDDFIGKSTAGSIHSGVVLGVVHEIEGFIDQYEQTNENIIIILTGGDADFLAKRLKNTIFAHSNFLLDSLNQMFQYQTQND